MAALALQGAGYRVVGRNVRTTAGEIDLLVRRRRCWIAVEVKARSHHPAPERTVRAEQLARSGRTSSSSSSSRSRSTRCGTRSSRA
ncbi:MAG: YraN family protein [Planctomycetota bacterium]